MRNHQVTIKDIAKELGISVSTVSRALKDHPDISTETKKKVQDLAKKLRYKPNTIALSLKNRRSYSIGVIIPKIVHHFFSSIISGIEDIARSKGYRVMIYQSNESYEREVENVDAILSHFVDGVIISMTKDTIVYDHFQKLVANNVPIVFFDRICPDLETDQVVIDDFKAAYNAVEHLINIGKRKIIHFAGPLSLEIGKRRRLGYIHALQKHDIKVDDNLIIKCDEYEDAIKTTQILINNNNIPDAIFAVNDSTAVGALIALKRKGFRIPEDVAIVGFTNGLISTVTDPTLTTVDQHGFEMGKKAAELLISRIEKDNVEEIRKIVVPTTLIIRKSTQK